MEIKCVVGREILDSRGNPTVEADIELSGGGFGRAAVPSGASTGTREALELRDGDRSRYLGKGVRRAVGHVNSEIAAAILGKSFDQVGLDRALRRSRRHAEQGAARRQRDARCVDGGAARRGRRGRPAALRAHRRRCGARSSAARLPTLLPVPMMNILNGGAHADTNVDFQEFMVMPFGAPTFAEALRIGAEIFHALRGILKKRGLGTGVGDEGGFAPNLKSNREALDVVIEAVAKAGCNAGTDVVLALDVAASEFFEEGGKYVFKKSGDKTRTSDEMIALYDEWTRQYPIASIEDGLGEGDWPGWAR